jgi:hypothetical protein
MLKALILSRFVRLPKMFSFFRQRRILLNVSLVVNNHLTHRVFCVVSIKWPGIDVHPEKCAMQIKGEGENLLTFAIFSY